MRELAYQLSKLRGGDEAKIVERLSCIADWLISNNEISWKNDLSLANTQIAEQSYRY
jgi:hypothetical protein